MKYRSATFLLLTMILGHSGFSNNRCSTIEGHTDYLISGDDVILTGWKYGGHFSAPQFRYEFHVKSVGSNFNFQIPDSADIHVVEIYIPKKGKELLSNFYLLPSITVRIIDSGQQVSFKGRNALQFKVQQTIQDEFKFYLDESRLAEIKFPEKLNLLFRLNELGRIKCLSYLDHMKEQIPTKLYNNLSVRINFGFKTLIDYRLYYYFIQDSVREQIALLKREYYQNKFLNLTEIRNISDGSEIESDLSDLILINYKVDSCSLLNKELSIANCLNYIIDYFTGTLKEQLITKLLYENRDIAIDELPFCLEIALKEVKSKDFRGILEGIRSTRTAGAKAFNFELLDDSGTMRHLSDFVGNVVLLDFWFTGCGNCRALHPIIDSLSRIIHDPHFKVITICSDKQMDMWKKSLRTELYSSNQSINLFTRGSDNPLLLFYNITAFPTLMLIDKNGKMCNPVLDARQDRGVQLQHQIEIQLKEKKDNN